MEARKQTLKYLVIGEETRLLKLKAVIFDVDGTLVDSNRLHVEAWREALRRYGRHLSYEKLHAHIGKGADQFMPAFLSRDEVARFGADVERFRDELFVRKYLPLARPFPKVRKLFERIQADGMRIALASSAKEPEWEQHKKALHIEDLVDVATSADDAKRSKPYPDTFEAALARLGDVTPEEAIVVGDSPYDVQAAGQAGMRTLGVLSGGFSEDTLFKSGVLEVYYDVADLLEYYDESRLVEKMALDSLASKNAASAK